MGRDAILFCLADVNEIGNVMFLLLIVLDLFLFLFLEFSQRLSVVLLFTVIEGPLLRVSLPFSSRAARTNSFLVRPCAERHLHDRW